MAAPDEGFCGVRGKEAAGAFANARSVPVDTILPDHESMKVSNESVCGFWLHPETLEASFVLYDIRLFNPGLKKSTFLPIVCIGIETRIELV